MSKIKYFLLAIVALVMTSCGSSEDSVKFESNTIMYNGEPTLEIVDATLTMESTECKSGAVTFTEDRPVLRVTFKVVKKIEEKVIYGNLGFQAYDADGSKLKKLKFNVGGVGTDYEQAKKLGELLNKEVGTTETIKFGPNKKGEMYMNFEVEKLDMFKMYIELSPYTEKESEDYRSSISSDDSEDSESVSSESDSEDWDSVLDSYEDYVNNYISLLKKAKNGDMDALSEYPSVMKDAQELSEKLQKAKVSMTSSQLSRYTKITTKMTQAAASMQ